MSDMTSYPVNRPWNEKVFSMPNIPRGSLGLLGVLRDILVRVDAQHNPSEVLSYEGSSSKISLEQICVRLRPMQLVTKTAFGWRLTDASKHWVDSGDDLFLAAFLCSNIRFLAEILYFLDQPRKSAELNEIATQEYGLNWKTISDINSRLVWLRQFGLVDFQEFSMLYLITPLGKEFLKHVKPVLPEEIARPEDDTDGEQEIVLEEWAKELCVCSQQQLVLRRPSVGYIPGDISDFADTIAEYLKLISSGCDYDTISNYANKNYGIAVSSLKTFMSTLTNIGLIKRKTDSHFSLTEIAERWLVNKGMIELICCIHRNCLYTLELLQELSGKSLSTKELSAIGKVSYGLEKESVGEIQKRIKILKAAKLIRNTSLEKFTITHRGSLLLAIISLQEPKLKLGKIDDSDNTLSSHESLLTELRLAAKDSMNPDRFEQAVKAAFELLGFSATWLGGSGKTDVLIRAPGSSKFSFSAAVDAKSTAAGSVTDSLINFDTLDEHRKKHHADYSVVVGGAFQNERLIKRAEEHRVSLLDVDSLEKLIRAQMEVPIKVVAYSKIFKKPGIADVSVIDEERQSVIRYGTLMRSVMNCMINESEDPITEGVLLERDIYRSLRDSFKGEALPTIDDISDMLRFLASPLIGCVGKTKEGYFAIGSLADAVKKFEFYSKCCQEN